MNTFPPTGFLRLKQILGDPKANPPIPPLIPISRAHWYAGIAEGRFPKPVKLGKRTSAWRAEDVYALINSFQDK